MLQNLIVKSTLFGTHLAVCAILLHLNTNKKKKSTAKTCTNINSIGKSKNISKRTWKVKPTSQIYNINFM